VKGATRRQLESEELAQSSKKLEEAKEIIEELTCYAGRLKFEVKVLKAECQVATDMKERVEAGLDELQNQLAKWSTEELEEAKETIAELQQYVARLTAEVRRSRAVCQTAITEKERIEADPQALQDEIADQSVTMEDFSVHIDEETHQLQDELADLRESYSKLEKRHKSVVQEVEILRKRAESYEAVKGKLQHDAGEEYLLQVRHDALCSEEVTIGGDSMAEQVLLSEVSDPQHDECSGTGTGSDEIKVTDDPTGETANDDALEDNVTKSNTDQPIIGPDNNGNLTGISTGDDGIGEKKTAARSRVFSSRHPHTFTGPGKLGLSAYYSVFHSAFSNSASSILGLQNGCQEKTENAETDKEIVEPTGSKLQDVVKSRAANFANDCYTFVFWKNIHEGADQLSSQDAGRNVDCAEGVGSQQDQASSPVDCQTQSHVLDAPTASVQAADSGGGGTVGEDAVGDAVGGGTVCHETVGGLKSAGKSPSFGGASDDGETGTDKVARGSTDGGDALGCLTGVNGAVDGLNGVARDPSSGGKSDGGGAGGVNGPGGTFSNCMSSKKPEMPKKKWWKRLVKFLAEMTSAMPDQFGAVGIAYAYAREASYVEGGDGVFEDRYWTE
jgi:hypothetical protein